MDDSEPFQLLHSGRGCKISALVGVFIHVVRACRGGFFQFSKEKLLRSYWHLFHLVFMQCDRSGRNAMFGQQPTGVVDQMSVLPHHSAHGGIRLVRSKPFNGQEIKHHVLNILKCSTNEK